MADDGGYAAAAARTAQVVVRESTQLYSPPKWGFVIYRCTYSSQARWDEFMSAIKNDLNQYLAADEDKDLRDTIDWTVVEDEANLEGATWEEARVAFDYWVTDELADGANIENTTSRPWEVQAPLGDHWSYDDKFAKRLLREPRYSHFIYVDEAAVNSVLDFDRWESGQYYITLVQTSRLDPYVREINDDGEEVELEEPGVPPEIEEYESFWQNLRRKIKADRLVALYGAVAQGDWPEGFETEDDGISYVLRL